MLYAIMTFYDLRSILVLRVQVSDKIRFSLIIKTNKVDYAPNAEIDKFACS